MLAIVTPEEMAGIDAAASVPVDELIERAGSAVARTALTMLGGAYGRRVVALVGPGHNGADGRVAARRLEARGVRVITIEAADAAGRTLPAADLVIDAAYGTGLRRPFTAPRVGGDPLVLSVDIASGVDGLTGAIPGTAFRADYTVTFAALKPGLLLAPGRGRGGEVEVIDIGLDVSGARAHLVGGADVASWLPTRVADAHKWHDAVWVIAGSPGMTGAAHLTASAAMRAGVGYVRLAVPGLDHDPGAPTEVVSAPMSTALDLDPELLGRFGALALGPGLGRDASLQAAVKRLVATADVPMVIDGDGLTALGRETASVLSGRRAPTILTPHDGEYRTLSGALPEADRFAAARSLAAGTGAVVLLKGPTTVVADPSGNVLVSVSGDARLATAGTGDVLTGVIAALLARGVTPLRAAAGGAYLHGRASMLGPAEGLVAHDIVDALPRMLVRLRAAESADAR
jgi:hydroxyethylthiazole kinase-like uncharacterized protein yjeF